jgi:hypothetical protein
MIMSVNFFKNIFNTFDKLIPFHDGLFVKLMLLNK